MKRVEQITLICLFVGFLSVFGFLLYRLPDKPFSETENRSLATFPDLRTDSLLNGRFASEINDYFADQFPFRTVWVTLKAFLEECIGKGENNGILIGKDGQLAKRLFDMRRSDGTVATDSDLFDPAHIRSGAQNLRELGDLLSCPMVTLLPPRTLDITASSFDYPDEESRALGALLKTGVGDSYIDLFELLRARHEDKEKVYYRTDHHWTTLGAYYAYVEVMRSFGMEEEIIPMSSFDRRVVSKHFRGTYLSKSGAVGIPSEQIECWYLGDEDDYLVTADGRVLEGFYNPDYLDLRDQYSFFLDGTHDIVTVQKKDTEHTRPTLLIFKDSFANALAPFLSRHFDLVLCNLSSPKKDFSNVLTMAEEWNADAVLVVYSVGNLVNTDRIHRLKSS